MRETWVWSLDWEDLLEKEMVTHSSILAWEIPWTGKPGVLQYLGSQRVRPNLAIKQQSTKAADNTHYCRSVAQSCLTLCDPMDCTTPNFPVLHYLPEFAQTHVHWVGDAIQPSHPLSSAPSPPVPNPSQHQSLFQWVNSLHEVAKVLKFQLQQHSFQRNPRAEELSN